MMDFSGWTLKYDVVTDLVRDDSLSFLVAISQLIGSSYQMRSMTGRDGRVGVTSSIVNATALCYHSEYIQ
jgi:hypothetical protein